MPACTKPVRVLDDGKLLSLLAASLLAANLPCFGAAAASSMRGDSSGLSESGPGPVSPWWTAAVGRPQKKSVRLWGKRVWPRPWGSPNVGGVRSPTL